jgi:hypothetical protein
MSLIHDKMLRGHGMSSPAKSRSIGIGTGRARSTASASARAGSPANAPAVSAEGQRRRRVALFILILLLMFISFWIGRATFQSPAPLPPAPVLAAPIPVPAAVTALPAVTTPVAAKAAATIAVAVAASIPAASTAVAVPRGPETTLLEVSVGTTKRGGLTLKFDHPVSWTVDSAVGSTHAEIDVQGVQALGTFPRNLPLPPGIKAIHAGITAPDVLNLGFDLRPGFQAYTSPMNGPSAVLNVYFRTASEQAAIESQPQAGETAATGACGASTSAASLKAMDLLQRSLARNPGNADVRGALAMLATCDGNGVEAENLTADGLKISGTAGVKIAVVDASLLLVRGDTDAAIQVLKTNTPSKILDAGYSELLADFEAAVRKP